MTVNSQSYWTDNGVDCYYRKAACHSCELFANYGFRKDHPVDHYRCRQAATNQELLDAGIKPPPKPEKIASLLKTFGCEYILPQVARANV